MSNLEENDKEHVEGEGEETPETPPASLEGKGWDVLVGGKENPFAMGGSDPFDQGIAVGGAFAGDAEADRILKSAPKPAEQPSATAPADAFWDRGRGAESAEPSPQTGQTPEAPPRDLSPEELGFQPASTTPPAQPLPTPSLSEMLGGAETPTPGLSAGVTVTPIGAGIPEAAPSSEIAPTPVAPAIIEVPSSGETGAAKPAIIEVTPQSVGAPPVTAPIGGPVAIPAGQLPEDVMAGPVVTPMGGMLSAPATPPWPIPMQQGVGGTYAVADPWAQQPPDAGEPATPAAGEASEPVPDKDIEKMLITPERITALWEEINETYNLVVNDVRGHFNTTEQAIEHLKEARALLLSGPDNFDNAERVVNEVKSRLRLEEKVRQWSSTRGAWLATYLVTWLLLLSLGSLLTNRVQEIATQFVPDWMAATWLPGLFGGLGGVIGALWVLNKHITRNRDFDPIHTMWYVTNPFMGIALGVGTYVIVRGGGWVLTTVAGSGEFNMTPALALTMYALCFVVGFNQNVLWAMVDRFIKTIIPAEEDKTAATDETVPSESAPTPPPAEGPTG